jgi:glycosyltransferase involved in cell wall biosynthesis
MDLDSITPLILTYNEAPNITRTLERLSWAGDIVVVDSISSDETLGLISKFPRARVFKRPFDSHEAQWNFALSETGITSELVLALDADYMVTPDLVEEFSNIQPDPETGGYNANFIYCVNGHQLRGSAYPPVTVLYRRAKACYRQDGHTQRLVITGKVEKLHAVILHDDRKSVEYWLRSQARYMRIEAKKLAEAEPSGLNLPDRLRKLRFVAPPVMLFYVLIVKRAIFDGRPGLFYAFQRTVAELILSLYLIEGDIRRLTSSQRDEGPR